MAKNKIEQTTRFSEFYNDQDRKDVALVIDWLNKSENNTNRWLAKSIGKSDGTVSLVIKGTYNAPVSPVLRLMLSAINDVGMDTTPGEFIKTSVFQSISFAINAARKQRRFAIVAGAPGVGKTTCIEEYQKENPNMILLYGDELVNSSVIMDMLCESLCIRQRDGKKHDMQKRIIAALVGTSRGIILDEADKCQADVPDKLRTISDRAKVPIILVGNVPLHDDVRSGKHRYDLISSRVVNWQQPIRTISPTDTEALFRQHFTESDIDDSESFSEVCLYAGQVSGGSARTLVESLIFNIEVVRESQAKKNKQQKISRLLIQTVAKKFMGITEPPKIPRKTTTAVPV